MDWADALGKVTLNCGVKILGPSVIEGFKQIVGSNNLVFGCF